MTAETVNDRMAVKPPFAAVLRNRRFRAVWLSQFVSGIGDWLVVGLLIPLVSALTQGSSFAVAGIMIAKIIPALLFSSVTGVFVDRFDRRTALAVALAGLVVGTAAGTKRDDVFVRTLASVSRSSTIARVGLFVTAP